MVQGTLIAWHPHYTLIGLIVLSFVLMSITFVMLHIPTNGYIDKGDSTLSSYIDDGDSMHKNDTENERKEDFRASLNHWILGRWEGEEYIPMYTIKSPVANINWKNTMMMKNATNKRYRLFSSDEVVSCLREKSVIVIGDSFMRNLYVGLVDLLIDSDDNTYIATGAAKQRLARIKAHVVPPELGVTVRLISPTWLSFRDHMDILKSQLEELKLSGYVVMNVLIHDVKTSVVEELGSEEAAENAYFNALDEWARQVASFQVPLIWVTSPSFDSRKTPKKYHRNQRRSRMLDLNMRSVQVLRSSGHERFLDIFHLTETCYHDNCTNGDGAHMNRWVNRMKAQVLLNGICAQH